MKNKVIIVGDSYTYGHGLLDRVHYYDRESRTWVGQPLPFDAPPSIHCWPSLAVQDFTNFEILNFAKAGNSNDNMFIKLANEINSDTALVIFAGSFPDRLIVKHHNFDNMVVPWIAKSEMIQFDVAPKSYLNAKENFLKHLYTDKIGTTYSIMTILAAWSLSLTHQAKFAWSIPQCEDSVINSKELTTPHIQSMNFPSIARYPFADVHGGDYYDYTAIDGHSNEFAHQLYYTTEIKPLLTRLLT